MNAFILIVASFVYSVDGSEEESEIIEARGKAKYALLTNLAILLAVKVGLYKVFLGIGLIIASMKTLVVMAWALAIAKYVPDAWPHYKHADFKHSHYYGDFGVHFFYVAATKLFILKIVYGIIFFVLLTKGWHFVLWFIHYIKHKKEHVEYIEPAPIHHGYHDHGFDHHGFDHHGFDHHGFDHHGFDHHSFDHHEYEEPGYGQPYQGYGEYELGEKKRIYDSDGSYSVKVSTRA